MTNAQMVEITKRFDNLFVELAAIKSTLTNISNTVKSIENKQIDVQQLQNDLAEVKLVIESVRDEVEA